MTEKVNLNAIKRIPPEEFKEILQSWMDQKEITKLMQMKLRKQIISDFQKTEISKKLEVEKQKHLFSPKGYVIDTLQAEHLYSQNNHFTLSVLFTESRHSELLPNFEGSDGFRFEKTQIRELMELLGLKKTDQITRRVMNKYKTTRESFLSVLLMELISSQNSVETRTVAMQTETQQALDLSVISSKSKSKRLKRKKHHGLSNQEFKMRKPKKLKEVLLIADNLEKMSRNVNLITRKLDGFKNNPGQDESKTIISTVGIIMNQLNGCISNFESICQDIKQINDTRNRNYDEWMDDLQNSDNGRRFLRKLQKSFSRVMSEEKTKMQKDYRRKFDREKSKLSKLYSRTSLKRNDKLKTDDYPDKVVKEISEIYQNTCTMIKTVEQESELFEKSLEVDHQKKLAEMRKRKGKVTSLQALTPTLKITSPKLKPTPNFKSSPTKLFLSETKLKIPDVKTNLNDCRQIYSAESSSDPCYSSKSFEDDPSDENN